LAYVQTHFNCVTQEIVRPDKPIPFPDLNLPTPDPDSNDDLPDDDDYDEDQRKPPDSYRDWWYHSDHLGSSTYLTDNFGRPSHYYETLPFGEMIVEHNQSTTYSGGQYENAYKFNGKELDEATQMYYYGARYYDPRISIFISVDPLAEQAPNWTPYRYAFNNPIMFVDPTGLWEFKYDSDLKTLSLHKSNDKDNLASFLKESGMSERQVAKQLFGGGKSGKEAMNNFFNGEDTCIDVSDLSGSMGKMLKGMETALGDGNMTLSQNSSDAPQDAINNCYNSTLNLTSSGSVDSKPLASYGSSQSLVSNPFLYDNTLLDKYRNVSNPALGDAIRYSNDGGTTSTHGAVFLLQRDTGVQIFSKNGYHNSEPYRILMQSQITGGIYGQPSGIKNQTKTTVDTRGQSTTQTINHPSPYYRR